MDPGMDFSPDVTEKKDFNCVTLPFLSKYDQLSIDSL